MGQFRRGLRGSHVVDDDDVPRRVRRRLAERIHHVASDQTRSNRGVRRRTALADLDVASPARGGSGICQRCRGNSGATRVGNDDAVLQNLNVIDRIDATGGPRAAATRSRIGPGDLAGAASIPGHAQRLGGGCDASARIRVRVVADEERVGAAVAGADVVEIDDIRSGPRCRVPGDLAALIRDRGLERRRARTDADSVDLCANRRTGSRDAGRGPRRVSRSRSRRAGAAGAVRIREAERPRRERLGRAIDDIRNAVLIRPVGRKRERRGPRAALRGSAARIGIPGSADIDFEGGGRHAQIGRPAHLHTRAAEL